MFPIHLVLPPVELSLLDGSPAQWCISIWEQFAYLFNPIYDTSVMYSLNPLNCSKSHAIYIHGETFSFHFFIVALVGLIAVYELPTTIDTDYDSVYLLYAHFYSHELTYIQGISLTLTRCSLFFLILLSKLARRLSGGRYIIHQFSNASFNYLLPSQCQIRHLE
jgi:hypothetical protein